jgi:hypothetical protein
MLQSTRNQMNMSIIDKLKNQGAPKAAGTGVGLMGPHDDDEEEDEQDDMMGKRVKAKLNINNLAMPGKKSSQKKIDEDAVSAT